MRTFALLVLLTACAEPAALPARAPAQPALAKALIRSEAEGFGLSAEFSQAPASRTEATQHAHTVYVQQDGSQAYHLTAVSTLGRDRPKDEDWYGSLRAKMGLAKTRDVALSTFDGVELSGASQGRQLRARVFAVGDSLLIAEAIGSKGVLDEASAERFLSSVRLELPWRIHASPTTKFSVMVPARAIIVDKTEAKAEARSSSLGFFVGGRHQLVYWTTAEELVDRDPSISDDVILDAALDGVRRSGSDITWHGPLESSGMRGREFLASSRDSAMMGRVWLGQHFVYLLMISATTRDGLQSADSSKFYGSFVAY